MTVNYRDYFNSLPEDRQKKIKDGGQKIIEQANFLRELRTSANLTQKDIAEALGINQEAVSRLERRPDMLLSTINRMVSAMGGEAELVIRLPGLETMRVQSSHNFKGFENNPSA